MGLPSGSWEDYSVAFIIGGFIKGKEATMQGFNYYFMFTCLDGKKRRISIIRFSFKQMETILKMIQERGGLIDQDINDIINPLRIRKK